ncbi:hypothetical protein AB0O07_31625 [Streptomyces sp. NPDC093085]|uniref:hypothetical protein n=1 Tax=Streptomyces sp. NPDC093085 TaxID=3155068 RepID=UPI00341B45F9
MADLSADVITNLLPIDLADEHFAPDAGFRLASRAVERPGSMAPPTAASAAVAETIALRILEHRVLHLAGEVMRGLLEAMREELWQISATSIDSWGRSLSSVLNAVHLAALAPSRRPSDQLRFRVVTAMPSRPKRLEAIGSDAVVGIVPSGPRSKFRARAGHLSCWSPGEDPSARHRAQLAYRQRSQQ